MADSAVGLPPGFVMDGPPAGFVLDTPQEKPSAVSRFLDPLNPMHLVHALYKPASDPNEDSMVTFGRNVIGLVKDTGMAQVEQGKAALESWKKGNHADAVAQGMAALTPILGPMSQQAAEKFNQGDIAGGMGSLTAIALPEILHQAPGAIRATVKGAKTAGKAVADFATSENVVKGLKRSSEGAVIGSAMHGNIPGVLTGGAARIAAEKLGEIGARRRAPVPPGTTTPEMVRRASVPFTPEEQALADHILKNTEPQPGAAPLMNVMPGPAEAVVSHETSGMPASPREALQMPKGVSGSAIPEAAQSAATPVEYRLDPDTYSDLRGGHQGSRRITAHDAEGNEIGRLDLRNKGSHFEATGVRTDLEHQRKGIATGMYDYAVNQGVGPIKPSYDLTSDGKALWEANQRRTGSPSRQWELPPSKPTEAVPETPAAAAKKLSPGAADAKALSDKLVQWDFTPDEAKSMNEASWVKLAGDAGITGKIPSAALRKNAIFNLIKEKAGPPMTAEQLFEKFRAGQRTPSEVRPNGSDVAPTAESAATEAPKTPLEQEALPNVGDMARQAFKDGLIDDGGMRVLELAGRRLLLSARELDALIADSTRGKVATGADVAAAVKRLVPDEAASLERHRIGNARLEHMTEQIAKENAAYGKRAESAVAVAPEPKPVDRGFTKEKESQWLKTGRTIGKFDPMDAKTAEKIGSDVADAVATDQWNHAREGSPTARELFESRMKNKGNHRQEFTDAEWEHQYKSFVESYKKNLAEYEQGGDVQ